MVSPTLAEPGMPLAKSVPDVYIQFQSQTHAWRCVMLHRTGKFFPDGAGLTVGATCGVAVGSTFF